MTSTPTSSARTAAVIKGVTERDATPYIGFPAATDQSFGPLHSTLDCVINNIGDPFVDGLEHRNVKDLERELLTIFCDLFRAPADDRWGYVTTGGTEGNKYGLWLARTRFPRATVYHSTAAHYSVPKAVHLLGMRSVTVAATPTGEMDYAALHAAVRHHQRSSATGLRARPVIVVATAGTTMTEAIDDIEQITAVLDQLGVHDRYIHVDAALSGIPLALNGRNPSCDLTAVDSLSFSGHKFLGVKIPCGIVLTRRTHRDRIARAVDYIQGDDATISGSRSGHSVLMLWHVLQTHGLDGLRQRARDARAVAAYTHAQLEAVGWPAWRHDHAMTVVLRTPSAALVNSWALASADGWSHIVCVPGVDRATIDLFIAELADELAARDRVA